MQITDIVRDLKTDKNQCMAGVSAASAQQTTRGPIDLFDAIQSGFPYLLVFIFSEKRVIFVRSFDQIA